MMTRMFGFCPDAAGAGCAAVLGWAGAAGFFSALQGVSAAPMPFH
jgi:hypothetical protein